MIDLFAAYLTAMLLLLALITFLWFTRDDPGPREYPMGEDPYPYDGPLLDPFPETDGLERRELYDWLNPGTRLATTGELRALAYAGNLEVIDSEVAAFKALMQLDDWIPNQ